MRKIHNGGQNPFRMPFILYPEDEERWLDPNLSDDEIKALLKPYPADGMAAHPVRKDFRNMDPYRKEVIGPGNEDEAGQELTGL